MESKIVFEKFPSKYRKNTSKIIIIIIMSVAVISLLILSTFLNLRSLN